MDFYTPIFKRKSFHLFKETGKLTDKELGQIRAFIKKVTPLCPEIRTEIQLVPESETTCKRGAEYANIVRFAPSACNTQPWMVEAVDGQLTIYRYKKPGKRGIMPADKVTYYNRIDMGIFLFFLETCLRKEGIDFERELFSDDAEDSVEKVLTARYLLSQYEI